MPCEKVTFDTFFAAQHSVNRANNFGRARNRRLAQPKPKRAYKCEACGKFHVTSKLKPRATKKRFK